MKDLANLRPTERFTGLAAVYARCRPDYPAEALDHVTRRCGLRPGAVLVDVGCGTGIASRLFAARGLKVLGVEPNADMRCQAESEPVAGNGPAILYCEGRAEATGLPEACADAVLAAQAFHWFQPEAALREFHRLLRPGGWAMLLWNERDESDPFTAAYGNVIRTTRDVAGLEADRASAGEALLHCPLFDNAERTTFRHEQPLDLDGVLGRALSVSYAPKDPADVERYRSALEKTFARFQDDGQVTLVYQTLAFTARRRETPSSQPSLGAAH